ncbi:glycosyl transferase, family 2 [Dorea sp. D27]|nr:glycosyl transferase, family 2 [Dorea sp. D27]
MMYEDKKPAVSVVVPCYNEQEVLPLYVKAMQEVIKKMEPAAVEIIFVDDGSSDETLKLLKAYHEQNKDYRYLSFSRNFGKESALYAGLKAAEGEYVVVMDADLQDPPDYIPEMFGILQEGEYDCVATRRGDRQGEARIRSFLSASFYKFINKLSEVQIVEGARDFRMMNRKMADAILSLSECNRFSKGLFGWVGFQTKWLEYHNVERAAGDTKWSLWKLFKYSIDGILGFSTVPLSMASYGGILFCGAAFCMIVFLVVKNLFWHDPVAGWPAMMCVIFLIGGIQLLCIGISGQYLARAYTEIKNRPIYLLRESSDEEDAKTDSKSCKKQGRYFISLDSYNHTAHPVYPEDKKRISGRL